MSAQYVLVLAFVLKCVIVNAYKGFYLTDGEVSWHQAELYCQQQFNGTHLATIVDSSTSDRVESIIRAIMTTLAHINNDRAWIGCSAASAGNYEWASMQPFNYTPRNIFDYVQSSTGYPVYCLMGITGTWYLWEDYATFPSFVCDGGQDLTTTTTTTTTTTVVEITTTSTTVLAGDGGGDVAGDGASVVFYGMGMMTLLIIAVSVIVLLCIACCICIKCAKTKSASEQQRMENETKRGRKRKPTDDDIYVVTAGNDAVDSEQPSAVPTAAAADGEIQVVTTQQPEAEGNNKLDVVTSEQLEGNDAITNS